MLRRVLLLVFMATACSASAADPIRQVYIAGVSTANQYGPERAPREGSCRSATQVAKLADFSQPAASPNAHNWLQSALARRDSA